jgi:hypothetical protein
LLQEVMAREAGTSELKLCEGIPTAQGISNIILSGEGSRREGGEGSTSGKKYRRYETEKDSRIRIGALEVGEFPVA